MSAARLAINWVEQGYVPDGVFRQGIRRLCKECRWHLVVLRVGQFRQQRDGRRLHGGDKRLAGIGCGRAIRAVDLFQPSFAQATNALANHAIRHIALFHPVNGKSGSGHG